MNKKVISILLFLTLVSISLVSVYAQCSGHSASSSSEQPASAPDVTYWGGQKPADVIKISSINILLSDKEKYFGEIIALNGKISSECPSGHWFYIENNNSNDKIYVLPIGFTVPQKIGAKVTVYGKWTKQDGKWLIEAKRVELIQ